MKQEDNLPLIYMKSLFLRKVVNVADMRECAEARVHKMCFGYLDRSDKTCRLAAPRFMLNRHRQCTNRPKVCFFPKQENSYVKCSYIHWTLALKNGLHVSFFFFVFWNKALTRFSLELTKFSKTLNSTMRRYDFLRFWIGRVKELNRFFF